MIFKLKCTIEIYRSVVSKPDLWRDLSEHSEIYHKTKENDRINKNVYRFRLQDTHCDCIALGIHADCELPDLFT